MQITALLFCPIGAFTTQLATAPIKLSNLYSPCCIKTFLCPKNHSHPECKSSGIGMRKYADAMKQARA